MAGGLFVFVRTAPPGGCALAITAGQYRPPMAHCPLSRRSGGPFLFIPLGSIAGRDSVFASLSRPRRVSTRRLSLTALAGTRRAGLFCFVRTARVMSHCHAGLRSGRESAYKSRYCIHITLCCLCFFVRMPVALETAPLCGPAIFEY